MTTFPEMTPGQLITLSTALTQFLENADELRDTPAPEEVIAEEMLDAINALIAA